MAKKQTFGDKASKFVCPLIWVALRRSNLDNSAEAKGFSAAICNVPRTSAKPKTGKRNCDAEIPDARATTNSWFLVIRKNAIILPNKTANGNACCPRKGSFNKDIFRTRPIPTSSRDDASRSSSMISNKNIRLRNTANTDINILENFGRYKKTEPSTLRYIYP